MMDALGRLLEESSAPVSSPQASPMAPLDFAPAPPAWHTLNCYKLDHLDSHSYRAHRGQ